jgi:DNA-binding NarL/FixJ family response regulator
LGPNVPLFWEDGRILGMLTLVSVCSARGKELRVLLVDDHPVVREGLRALLASQDDIEVAGEAASGASAIRRAGYDSPDVVVMDVRLPDMSGVAACRTIVERFPEIKVLMLSSHVDEETVHEAILAGASGYLVKRIDGDRIVDAVRSVSTGASVIDPAATAKLFNQIRGDSVGDPVFSQLSEREVRILELIADGLTNREIADRVFLAEKTVKNYISRLLAKLGLRNRNEAAAYMARRIADRESRYPPEDWLGE